MARTDETCRMSLKWIRGHKGKSCLAPLTGQDHRALLAFIHLLELYAGSDAAGQYGAIEAMKSLVRCAAQPSVLHLFRDVIPSVLDWGDRDTLWPKLIGA